MCFKQDPSVNELEETLADLFGKEAIALFSIGNYKISGY